MKVRSILLTINISSLALLFLVSVLFAGDRFSFDNFKIVSLICTLVWFSGSVIMNRLGKNKTQSQE